MRNVLILVLALFTSATFASENEHRVGGDNRNNNLNLNGNLNKNSNRNSSRSSSGAYAYGSLQNKTTLKQKYYNYSGSLSAGRSSAGVSLGPIKFLTVSKKAVNMEILRHIKDPVKKMQFICYMTKKSYKKVHPVEFCR